MSSLDETLDEESGWEIRRKIKRCVGQQRQSSDKDDIYENICGNIFVLSYLTGVSAFRMISTASS